MWSRRTYYTIQLKDTRHSITTRLCIIVDRIYGIMSWWYGESRNKLWDKCYCLFVPHHLSKESALNVQQNKAVTKMKLFNTTCTIGFALILF